MLISNLSHKIIPFAILPIAVISLTQLSPFPIGNTLIRWIIKAIILFAFLWNSRYGIIPVETRKKLTYVLLLTLWFAFCFFRGPFLAEIYWDWKALLNNGFVLLIPIVSFYVSSTRNLQSILGFYVKYTLPLFLLILIFFKSMTALGHFLMPFCFLIIFFPVLTNPMKGIVLLFVLIGIFCDLSTRSFLIKFGTPILLVIFFYYTRRFFFMIYVMKVLRFLFLIAPIILFTLAALNIFNVFKIDEYIKSDVVLSAPTADGSGLEKQSITKDSRTFLYVENLQTAYRYNSWLIGRSPALGHDSPWFAFMDPSGRGVRHKDEAAILNIFSWTGIIGVILYFLVFYRASYLAIYNSNNIFSKLVGLFVAFRWVYSWVEDINNFDLSYFTLWFMIGFCFSDSFRKMNNMQVKLWSRGIFDNRYRAAFVFYQRLLSRTVSKLT